MLVADTAAARAQAVRDAAAARLDELLADLAAWVDMDTPSEDAAALDAFAHAFAARLTALGWEPELVPRETGLHVHARLHGSGRTRVALVGHHDTVFPSGTAAARPFAVEGDLARGPGVADMKGGLLVAAWAGSLLRGAGVPVGTLELVSVPDEEPRSGPFATLAELAGCDAALVLECGRPGNGVVTARKGGRWLELHAHRAARARRHRAGARAQRGAGAVHRGAAHRRAERRARRARRAGDAAARRRRHQHRAGCARPCRSTSGPGARTTSTGRSRRSRRTARTTGSRSRSRRPRTRRRWTAPRARTWRARPRRSARPSARRCATWRRAARRTGRGVRRPASRRWTGSARSGADDHTPDEWIEVGSIAPRCGLVAGLVTAIEEGLA